MKSDFLKTKAFRICILVLAILIFSLIVFFAGMAVGFRKGIFFDRFGENYEKNFIGPRGPMNLGEPFGGQFMNSHGSVGEIVSINNDLLLLKGDNGMEESVLVNASTTIRQFTQSLTLADLKPSLRIAVIGEPNASGQIEAKLIRVFPQ